ncbi:MAG: putative 1 [Myxococcales bacterium]|nr:putative 1 [Myxococcales bacterium]
MTLRSLSVALALSCVRIATALAEPPRVDPAPAADKAPAKAAPASKTAAPVPASAIKAVVGKPAPAFTLTDLAGKTVELASFKGKIVVLEWFNPGCPYVKKSHTVGSLVDTAKKHAAKGVVWLAINSNAAGKQGHEASENAEAAKTFAMAHPILRDLHGAVGKAYGATNTPHMFVIDKKGMLVYAGAIDNSPDAERKSPTSGDVVNYVDAAVEAVVAGTPVKTPTSKAYGCSVKYGS